MSLKDVLGICPLSDPDLMRLWAQEGPVGTALLKKTLEDMGSYFSSYSFEQGASEFALENTDISSAEITAFVDRSHLRDWRPWRTPVKIGDAYDMSIMEAISGPIYADAIVTKILHQGLGYLHSAPIIYASVEAEEEGIY